MPRKNEIVKVDAERMSDPKRAKWVLTRVDELVAVIKRSYVELAKLLHEVSRNGYFRQLKNAAGESFLTLEQYADERLAWGERKARYFIGIYESLVLGAGIPEADIEEIDWSKAKEVARLPEEVRKDPAQMSAWIGRAKTLRHRDLQLEVNLFNKADIEAKGGTSKLRAEAFEYETFAFYPAQHKNVMMAIALAMKLTGSDKKSHCLDLIATDFIAGRAADAPVKLDHILSALERTFGVHIVAVSASGGVEKVVFGGKYAQEKGVA